MNWMTFFLFRQTNEEPWQLKLHKFLVRISRLEIKRPEYTNVVEVRAFNNTILSWSFSIISFLSKILVIDLHLPHECNIVNSSLVNHDQSLQLIIYT